MIMARRIVLEGGEVVAVLNRGAIVKGLTRNIVQCLNHYNIPLMLNHNIIRINGRKRVESVTVVRTDERKRAIPGTEHDYECDTVLLSVGLIPENELSRIAGIEIDNNTSGPYVNESMETSIPGIFACGNVVHVHDVVDFVTEESQKAGKSAARYAMKASMGTAPHVNKRLRQGDKDVGDAALGAPFDETSPEQENRSNGNMDIKVSGGITYCVPHKLRYNAMQDQFDLFMRVEEVYDKAKIVIKNQGRELASFNKVNLTPGEMIKQNVKKSIFENAAGNIEIDLLVGG
jgi:hypothetical protein